MRSPFLLFTDGSGCNDSFGGSASVAIHTGEPTFAHYVTRATYSTTVFNNVDRMEFDGLLNGLQSILDALHIHTPPMLEDLRRRRPAVAWFTDRESLALSVWRPAIAEAGVPRPPFYARRASPDLWRRFDYYEELFHVIPMFNPRETLAAHTEIDELASEMRELIKEWTLTREGRPPHHP